MISLTWWCSTGQIRQFLSVSSKQNSKKMVIHWTEGPVGTAWQLSVKLAISLKISRDYCRRSCIRLCIHSDSTTASRGSASWMLGPISPAGCVQSARESCITNLRLGVKSMFVYGLRRSSISYNRVNTTKVPRSTDKSCKMLMNHHDFYGNSFVVTITHIQVKITGLQAKMTQIGKAVQLN